MREWQRNSVLAQVGGMMAACCHLDSQPTVGKLGRPQEAAKGGYIGVPETEARRCGQGLTMPTHCVFLLRAIVSPPLQSRFMGRNDTST